jgi:phosphoglycerate dehydrogenase-like enzyme
LPFEYKELTGKVLSIIGFGAIGRQVALRATAFGMRILAIKRSPLINTNLNVEFVGTLENLHSILEDSDFVSVNLPITKETRGIIGAAELAVMKPTAYFINSSRAEVVDNKALLSALKNGSIAGAVLDVVDESLKKSFARLNNVILTPHISGESKESTARGIEVTAENIRRLINGQTLLNLVSPEKMY